MNKAAERNYSQNCRKEMTSYLPALLQQMLPLNIGVRVWLFWILSQLAKQWRRAMLVVSVCQQNQNALHRLLAEMLDEHCCSIGPVGPHNLLLFGSNILKWEIATARASTKPHSPCSSDMQLKLSDGCWFKSSSGEPTPTWFPGDTNTSAFASWQEVAAPWFFVFDLMDNVLKVSSV